MNFEEPSQDIDDLCDLETNDESAGTVTNTAENNAIISDIISVGGGPYFPYQYEAPLIGMVREIYIDKLDYMVGMVEFRNIFQELGIGTTILFK